MANDPSSKKEAPPTPTTDCGCGAALELANYKFLAQVLRFTTNGSTDYEGLMKDMGVTNIKKDSMYDFHFFFFTLLLSIFVLTGPAPLPTVVFESSDASQNSISPVSKRVSPRELPAARRR